MTNPKSAIRIAQKWEYKEIRRGSDSIHFLRPAELEQLGMEGWEMCGCFSNSLNGPFYTIYYFKRPL